MTKIPMRVDLTNDEHDQVTRLSSEVKEACEPVQKGVQSVKQIRIKQFDMCNKV